MTIPGALNWTLSGFADEISPSLAEQIATLTAHKISHLELRSVWDTNVVDLDIAQRHRVRELLDAHGISVSGIASPVGKSLVTEPFAKELERCRRGIEAAHAFETTIIRVFSFYIPSGQPPEKYRSEIIDRLSQLADLAASNEVLLAQENEEGLYGDTPGRCVDLLVGVNSEAFRSTFDAANFAELGVKPFDEAYPLLRPYLVYVQIKDFRASTGDTVIAGEGDGQIPDTLGELARTGFEGVFSLEPHLVHGGQFGGFSGPEGFGRAAEGFKSLLAQLPINLS